MDSVFVPIILGIFILILGIFNMKGNISSIHWYHRQRLTEENRILFGKVVGLGTIIIGASIIAFGALSLAAELLGIHLFIIIGSVIAAVGTVVGLALSLYAMIKYNKGIF